MGHPIDTTLKVCNTSGSVQTKSSRKIEFVARMSPIFFIVGISIETLILSIPVKFLGRATNTLGDMGVQSFDAFVVRDMPKSRKLLKTMGITKRRCKMKSALYYSGVWQFPVALPSLRIVTYRNKTQNSIFRETQNKTWRPTPICNT